MPTNRRRRLQDRRPDLSELDMDQRQELETGRPFFEGFRHNLEHFAEAWELHGEAILAEYIAKYPGRRPFAWWLLDHKKERPIQASLTPEQLAVWKRRSTHYGFFHSWVWGFEVPGGVGYLQELEAEYLDRLGLLADEELQVLSDPPAGAIAGFYPFSRTPHARNS